MDAIKINDFDRMDQYANQLSRNSLELTDLMNKISSEAHSSLENWNDRSAQDFMQKLEEQKRVINLISQKMEVFAQYVHRKANAGRSAANQQ